MRVQPMATFYEPGSFFAEDYSKELAARTAEAALAVAPPRAFAFKFWDAPVVDFEYDRDRFKVTPLPHNTSSRYFIGGQVFTCAELEVLAVAEGDPDKYRILISNVTSNGGLGAKAIRCRHGNWQTFETSDVLVPEPT